jgi:hypothetical protein
MDYSQSNRRLLLQTDNDMKGYGGKSSMELDNLFSLCDQPHILQTRALFVFIVGHRRK